MNVLICCGETTEKVVEALTKRFSDEGIKIFGCPIMTDIKDRYALGEHYDKIIAVEPGIIGEADADDMFCIKQNVAKFVEYEQKLNNESVYLFVCKTDSMAAAVFEEIFDLSDKSSVIVNSGKFTVGFFAELIKKEIGEIETNFEYKKHIEVEDSTPEDVEQDRDEIKNFKEIGDLTSGLFGESTDGIEESLSSNDLDTLFDNVDGLFDSTDGLFGDTIAPVEEKAETETEGSKETTEGLESELTEFDKLFGEEIDDFKEEQSTEEQDISDSLFDGLTYDDEEEQKQERFSDSLYEDEVPKESRFSDDLYSEPEQQEEELEEVEETPKETVEETDEDEAEEFEIEASKPVKTEEVIKKTDKEAKAVMDAFAKKGHTMLFMGAEGSGVSTIAYNAANTLNALGYSVLLVDLDFENRAQSFMTKEQNKFIPYDSASAIELITCGTKKIVETCSILKQGFYVATIGLGSKEVDNFDRINETTILRMLSKCKSAFNFVIFDCHIKQACNLFESLIMSADNLVIPVECSNWGITKAMTEISMHSNEDEIMRIFSSGQIVYNKYNGIRQLMGKKVKSVRDIAEIVDNKITEICGADIGLHFSDITVAGIINKMDNMDSCVYAKKQISDYYDGHSLFVSLVKNILVG